VSCGVDAGEEDARGAIAAACGGERLVQRIQEKRVVVLAEDAQAGGQIHRPDEQNINALHGRDRVDVLYSLGAFDLNDGQQVCLRFAPVVVEMGAVAGGANDGRCGFRAMSISIPN